MRLTAICVFGIEAILARELRNLGIEVLKISNGRIDFNGGFREIALANIWLRTAERIYINYGEFPAYSFDELFDGIKKLDWQTIIPRDGKITISSSNINSKLYSGRDCQKIAKKAIADNLCSAYGVNQLPETGPAFRVEIFIKNDLATISIDTTGTGLHKRGYRKLNVEAPLKETIAAALLQLSYWRPGRLLLDPFCGSGTFPIEAAMISAKIAPGLNRNFSFEEWDTKHHELSSSIKEEARLNIIKEKTKLIFGSDISGENISIAKKHAAAAGVSEMIEFKKADATQLVQPGEYGIMICNPPYGLRISEKEDVRTLYREMGDMFGRFETWSKYVLTDSSEFEKLAGKRADKRRKIYNGTISCTFYQYFSPKPL